MFFSSEREFKKALRDTLMRAAWYELLSTTASCTDILEHCDCKKCISICSCCSIVSSVSAPMKIFVCLKKKPKKKNNGKLW